MKMDSDAYPLPPSGESPPPPPQTLRATLWQLLGVGEQQIMPAASRRSNTLIFTIIGTLTLLAFGIGNVQQASDARLFTLGVVQLLEVGLLSAPAIFPDQLERTTRGVGTCAGVRGLCDLRLERGVRRADR